jgi:hypothetical protein
LIRFSPAIFSFFCLSLGLEKLRQGEKQKTSSARCRKIQKLHLRLLEFQDSVQCLLEPVEMSLHVSLHPIGSRRARSQSAIVNHRHQRFNQSFPRLVEMVGGGMARSLARAINQKRYECGRLIEAVASPSSIKRREKVSRALVEIPSLGRPP